MSKHRNMSNGIVSHPTYNHAKAAITKNGKRPSMEAALENAGVNTENYLSLRINKSDLPSNAELVIQIRDKRTGNLIPVKLHDDSDMLFGKNSRFYGKVMQDGHMFNPYIHRRFIAVQFRELIRRFGLKDLQHGAATNYDWKYAIDQIGKECHKLALLERRDKAAFAERSCFFTVSAVADILSDYVTEIHQHIDRAISRVHSNSSVYITGLGHVDPRNIRPIKYRYDCLRNSARQCRSYAELEQLIAGFDFAELPRHISLPQSFTNPFLEAGAYYTMKHAIMFEDRTIYGMNQQASLTHILYIARSGYTHACRDLYAQNGF